MAATPDPDAPFLIKSNADGRSPALRSTGARAKPQRAKKTSTVPSPKWSVSFIWWTPEQYRAWQAILPQINPEAGRKPDRATRQVYHLSRRLRDTQAIIYKIAIPRIQDNLIAEVTLYFEEVGAPDTGRQKGPQDDTNPNDSGRRHRPGLSCRTTRPAPAMSDYICRRPRVIEARVTIPERRGAIQAERSKSTVRPRSRAKSIWRSRAAWPIAAPSWLAASAIPGCWPCADVGQGARWRYVPGQHFYQSAPRTIIQSGLNGDCSDPVMPLRIADQPIGAMGAHRATPGDVARCAARHHLGLGWWFDPDGQIWLGQIEYPG